MESMRVVRLCYYLSYLRIYDNRAVATPVTMAVAVSVLWASAVSAFTTPRMRVLGTAGGYQVDALDGQEEALRAGAHRPVGDCG